MAEVRNLTNAERCSLFLLDPDQQDLVAKVFDGIAMKEVSLTFKGKTLHFVNIVKDLIVSSL